MYRLIFVDDEDFIRECFEEILDFSYYGFELVATFESAEDALQYLKQNEKIDGVISDIKMGGMSGLAFCEQAKNLFPDLAFILLTGYRDFEYAQQAIRQNVFDYLIKPTSYSDLEKLLIHLKEHLDKRSTKEPRTEYQYSDVVEIMRQLAQKQFHHDFSLKDAAKQLDMNAAYLSRLFKQQCAQTYSEYIISLRIEHAKKLLMDPTMKVYEIAYAVGYKDIQHFSKTFEQVTNMTPSEYRIVNSKKKEY